MADALGTLYLVGTPIGNREDITLRALRILREVDLIAAEDTRHSGQLLHHLQISTPMLSYHNHNFARRTPELVKKLLAGHSIALITDAGMPSVSDPGVELVQACLKEGILVVPIPGPSASLAALVASGLPTERFVFEGFLPSHGPKRRERLAQLAQDHRTQILYEAPHRLLRTLQDLQEVLGSERQIAIARELTKQFEQFWRGSLAQALAYFTDHAPRGEFTLVVAGADPDGVRPSEAEILSELRRLMAAGLSRSQASRQVAQNSDLDRRHIYQLALQLSEDPSLL